MARREPYYAVSRSASEWAYDVALDESRRGKGAQIEGHAEAWPKAEAEAVGKNKTRRAGDSNTDPALTESVA